MWGEKFAIFFKAAKKEPRYCQKQYLGFLFGYLNFSYYKFYYNVEKLFS